METLMTKKTLFALFFMAAIPVYNMTKSFNGAVTLKNQTFASLKINGAAHLTKVNVKKHLTVNGTITMINCRLKDVTINGATRATDCSFKDLAVCCHKATLNHCRLQNITVKKITPLDGFAAPSIQEIHLVDTQVHGDITFEKTGIVYLKGTSHINGQIKNGMIVQ
jgi:hypothetical protein